MARRIVLRRVRCVWRARCVRAACIEIVILWPTIRLSPIVWAAEDLIW